MRSIVDQALDSQAADALEIVQVVELGILLVVALDTQAAELEILLVVADNMLAAAATDLAGHMIAGIDQALVDELRSFDESEEVLVDLHNRNISCTSNNSQSTSAFDINNH